MAERTLPREQVFDAAVLAAASAAQKGYIWTTEIGSWRSEGEELRVAAAEHAAIASALLRIRARIYPRWRWSEEVSHG